MGRVIAVKAKLREFIPLLIMTAGTYGVAWVATRWWGWVAGAVAAGLWLLLWLVVLLWPVGDS